MAGWPTLLMMSVCTIYAEGAPSLRFLQGWVTMPPTQLLSVLRNQSRMRSRFPPLQSAQRTAHPLCF